MPRAPVVQVALQVMFHRHRSAESPRAHPIIASSAQPCPSIRVCIQDAFAPDDYYYFTTTTTISRSCTTLCPAALIELSSKLVYALSFGAFLVTARRAIIIVIITYRGMANLERCMHASVQRSGSRTARQVPLAGRTRGMQACRQTGTVQSVKMSQRPGLLLLAVCPLCRINISTSSLQGTPAHQHQPPPLGLGYSTSPLSPQ